MLGLRSLLNEEKRKSIVHNRSGSRTEFIAIVELVEIQDKIEKMNEGLINQILEIEHDLNERCKPLYHSRNQITKNIPHFWRIVFSRHPVIQYYQLSEDLQIFSHLTSLEVEEFKDGKSGYSITLNFDPNPYFED